jgi:hypothetical protein
MKLYCYQRYNHAALAICLLWFEISEPLFDETHTLDYFAFLSPLDAGSVANVSRLSSVIETHA